MQFPLIEMKDQRRGCVKVQCCARWTRRIDWLCGPSSALLTKSSSHFSYLGTQYARVNPRWLPNSTVRSIEKLYSNRNKMALNFASNELLERQNRLPAINHQSLPILRSAFKGSADLVIKKLKLNERQNVSRIKSYSCVVAVQVAIVDCTSGLIKL